MQNNRLLYTFAVGMTYVCAVLFGAFPAAEVWPKLGNSTEFFCSDLIKTGAHLSPCIYFILGAVSSRPLRRFAPNLARPVDFSESATELGPILGFHPAPHLNSLAMYRCRVGIKHGGLLLFGSSHVSFLQFRQALERYAFHFHCIF